MGKERKWLGIQFECCSVYTRVYRRDDDTHYVAKCPKCLKAVRIRVQAGGVATKCLRVHFNKKY